MRTQQLSVLDVAPAMTAARRSGGRVIVLVPGQATDDAVLEGTLARLASSEDQAVVFLGLCDTHEEEAQLRRRLNRLTGETRSRVPRQYRILRGMSWSGAMDAVRQEGDIFVFPYRDLPWVPPPSTGTAPGFAWNPSTRFLQAARPALQRSVVGLAGLLLDWAAPLLIVVGFFFLQVRVLDQVSTGSGHTLLLILSVMVEIGLLWRWEQWSSGRLRS